MKLEPVKVVGQDYMTLDDSDDERAISSDDDGNTFLDALINENKVKKHESINAVSFCLRSLTIATRIYLKFKVQFIIAPKVYYEIITGKTGIMLVDIHKFIL